VVVGSVYPAWKRNFCLVTNIMMRFLRPDETVSYDATHTPDVADCGGILRCGERVGEKTSGRWWNDCCRCIAVTASRGV